MSGTNSTAVSLTRLVADALGVAPAAITAESKAGDLAEWDSMGTMSILVALDRHFGLKLEPSETAQLASIAGIHKLLAAKGVAL